MNNGSTIKQNKIIGDVASGNIDKSTTIHASAAPDVMSLRVVVERVKDNYLNDPNFKGIIDRLNHFISSVDVENSRDLKTKLSEANRQDEVERAEELKEVFSKQLTKNNLSSEAQNAYVHILAKIKLDYDSKVKPRIKTNASLVDIEESVNNIIQEIYSELIGTNLEESAEEIKGMLYYLTGNCHIKWKY